MEPNRADPVLANLRDMLGANRPPPLPKGDHSDAIMVTRLPCVGRLHFVRDREGILFLLGIIAYWIYGAWSSYYVILMPHYADGRISDWYIYYHMGVAFLCLFSLLRASTLNPGRVPVVEASYADSHGWEVCPRCGRYRPPKAHHCRRCQQCVVRMDHHCPWINNCVGESNHHVFHLLLFYAFLLSFNTLVILMLNFWYWPKCLKCDHDSIPVKYGIWFQYLMFIMSATMATFMFSQFWSVHFNLLLNRTTIDSLQDGDNISVDPSQLRTAYNAYVDHCGTRNLLLWPFPWRRKRSKVLDGVYHT